VKSILHRLDFIFERWLIKSGNGVCWPRKRSGKTP
jgi:hypothetical protein